MRDPQNKSGMKIFLEALSKVLGAIAGISFLFGGGIIHAIGNVDRLFGEIVGIGMAVLCLIGMMVTKHMVDDIEWQEANREAAQSETKTQP